MLELALFFAVSGSLLHRRGGPGSRCRNRRAAASRRCFQVARPWRGATSGGSYNLHGSDGVRRIRPWWCPRSHGGTPVEELDDPMATATVAMLLLRGCWTASWGEMGARVGVLLEHARPREGSRDTSSSAERSNRTAAG